MITARVHARSAAGRIATEKNDTIFVWVQDFIGHLSILISVTIVVLLRPGLLSARLKVLG